MHSRPARVSGGSAAFSVLATALVCACSNVVSGGGDDGETPSGERSCDAGCADCAPVHRFSHGVPGLHIVATAAAPDGDVVVAGYTDSNVDLGGGLLANPGGNSTVVARFDSSGAHRWSKLFGTPEFEGAVALAVDASNSVVVTGWMHEPVDFGGGPRTGAAWLAKLDANGDHVFSIGFAGDEAGATGDVAIDASGNILVAGSFSGLLDLGGDELESSGIDEDVFLALFDPAGTLAWQRTFALDVAFPAARVAWGPEGDIRLAAEFYGVVDLGGAEVSTGTDDYFIESVFVATLDGSGNHVASRSLTTSSWLDLGEIAVDAEGDIVVTGTLDGVVDLGAGRVTGNGAYVAKYGPRTEHLWSKVFAGAEGHEAGWVGGVAVDGGGGIFLVAQSRASDFGGGALPLRGNDGAVAIARLDACGGHVWSRSFADAAEFDIGQIAVAPGGDLVAAGVYTGRADFGGGALGPAVGSYVVRLRP